MRTLSFLHRQNRASVTAGALSLLVALTPAAAGLRAEEIDLAGSWAFQLDPENGGIDAAWYKRTLPDRIRLPGSLQEQGYGSQLLQELERLAFGDGIRQLSFETAKARPLTLEFYRKHGYQETGSGFYGDVETLHFSKELSE